MRQNFQKFLFDENFDREIISARIHTCNGLTVVCFFWDFISTNTAQSLCVHNRLHYDMEVEFVYFILHYPVIIIMHTYLQALNIWNACQVYSVECVSQIKSIPAITFVSYMWLCFHPTNFSLVIVRIFVLHLIVIMNSDIWIINRCLGLCHETMVWYHNVYNIRGDSAHPFLLWGLWEYVYFIILSSSNWECESLAIV